MKPHPAHFIHAYAAKIAPEIARHAISDYSKKGDWVLDPMAGCGTVALEAALLNRKSVAIDIDPLAVLIARTKTLPLNGQPTDALLTSENVVCEEQESFRSGLLDVGFWFDPEVALGLTRLRSVLLKEANVRLRLLGAIAMSSMIVAKGTGSVANARDVAHSRPHRYKVPREIIPDVTGLWPLRIKKIAKILHGLELEEEFLPTIAMGDSRRLPIRADSIDLIVTSPPYFNAIDYPRAHRFSLAWLEGIFGVSQIDYPKLSRYSIGSVRMRVNDSEQAVLSLAELPPVALKIADSLTGGLKQAFARYVLDLDEAMAEMARVLKPDSNAFFVIGDSRVRDVDVSNHKVLMELALRHRLECQVIGQREIDPMRRQMPIKGGLSGRMRIEYIILMRKTGGMEGFPEGEE